ncbi:MAG: helix-turn-helix domain-containing protein [Kineosporiaceae bacterium]
MTRSGLTSTEFASRIGTSRSRLSTYASGRVVPSAALMVRIRRTRRARVGTAVTVRSLRSQAARTANCS